MKVNRKSCIGLAGNLEGCEVTEAKATGLPWVLQVNAEDLTAKGWKVDYSFNAGCAVKIIEISFPELTLRLEENPKAFNLIAFNALGSAVVDGKAAELGYFGSLSLPEAEFGKYGIG